MSGEIEWRWADPQGQQRLVRVDELRAALVSGVIAPNTPVWRQGWANWKPAYDVPELSTSASANGATLNIPPPPLFIVAVQHEYEDKGVSPDPPASHDEPPPPPRYVPGAAPSFDLTEAPVPALTAKEMPAPLPAPAHGAPNQAILFPAVPNPPAASPTKTTAAVEVVAAASAKATISTSRLRAALPQPPTLSGMPELTPPSSLPHSASPPGGRHPEPEKALRPSSFPPEDSGWDVEPPVKAPVARPSETVAGGLQALALGSDANTAVDMNKLSPADAERILAGGPSLSTVVGVPALVQSALPPPPPLRPSSVPPAVVQAATPLVSTSNAAPAPAQPPASARPSNRPPPVRRRGQTLMLYGGAPHEDDAPEPQPSDAPPIKVPGPGVQAPKAVTQAPPWTGDSSVAPFIPKLPPPPVPQIRPMIDSVEEISGSIILAEDSGADVTARRQKIEDLSDSHLLPDASGSAPQLAPAATPAPWNPTRTMHAEPAPPPVPSGPTLALPARPSEVADVPPGVGVQADPFASFDAQPALGVPASPSGRLVHDLNDVWQKPRRRNTLAAGAGGALFIVAVALVAHYATGSRAAGQDGAVPGVSTVVYSPPSTGDPTSTPVAGAAPAPASVSGPEVPSTAPCALGGPAHVIAPKAQVRIGVETLASQGRLALGFVTGDKDGLAVGLAPASLTAVTTARQHSHEPIRRLVPGITAKGVTAVADADRKGDRMSGARTVAADVAFVVGSSEGKLVWGARASDAPRSLWTLDGDGPVEALRVVTLEEGGYAVAFRQGTAIFLGALAADKSPNGALSRVVGLGQQIGSPALGASDGMVMAAWADRASTSDPWMLRTVRWRPGRAAGDPQSFAIPPGGLGEQAMSPGLTGVAGGRFLLSWTEGQVQSHQVRAQTLASSGEALGPPLTVSSEGINAGQGQPAVLPDGHGLVAYMASPAGATAQVVATPVACPLSAP